MHSISRFCSSQLISRSHSIFDLTVSQKLPALKVRAFSEKCYLNQVEQLEKEVESLKERVVVLETNCLYCVYGTAFLAGYFGAKYFGKEAIDELVSKFLPPRETPPPA